MRELDPSVSLVSSNAQLNHYFEGGDPTRLAYTFAPHVSPEAVEKMRTIAAEGKSISVRTRGVDGTSRIVMKASIGDDSSANGVMRMEVDEQVPLSLEEVDALVLSCGYSYQAKWSREREEYQLGDVAVCLDKNAGYGYLAEFEKVVHDASEADGARKELETLMEHLGVSELPQDRLERMFAHYNAHWPEYYGTDNIFTIE